MRRALGAHRVLRCAGDPSVPNVVLSQTQANHMALQPRLTPFDDIAGALNNPSAYLRGPACTELNGYQSP